MSSLLLSYLAAAHQNILQSEGGKKKLQLSESNISCKSLRVKLWMLTFFLFGASALPSRTAWCLRTPLAFKTISSLIPPSSVGVQVTTRVNEPPGWKQGPTLINRNL